MISVGFTRPRDRIAEGERICSEMGFEPFGAPSFDPVRGDKVVFDEIEEVLSSGEAYFTLFASITAVEECVDEYGKEKLLALLEKTNVACTGSSTEKVLKRLTGRDTDLVPEVYSGVGVAEEIADEVAYKTVVLLRSAGGDGKIVDILEKAHAKVLDEPVYDMVPAQICEDTEELLEKTESGTLDALLMTSPNSFLVFYGQMTDRFGKDRTDEALRKTFKVAIGRPTAESMSKAGMPCDTIAETSTFEGMLETVKKKFAL